MDFKEVLKQAELSEEQINKVEAGMKENKLYLADEENLSDRYGKLKRQKEDIESQLTAANELVKDLQGQSSTTEDLKAKLSEYENQVNELQSQNANKEKDYNIRMELVKSGAKNVQAVYGLLNVDKLELDEEGKVKGLDEQLTGIKENDSYLFKSEDDDKGAIKNQKIITDDDLKGSGKEEQSAFARILEKY